MSAGDIEVILFRLQSLDTKMDEMRADMRETRGDFENRMRALESLRDRAEGVGIAAKALWAFIGAGGLGVVYALVHIVTQNVK